MQARGQLGFLIAWNKMLSWIPEVNPLSTGVEDKDNSVIITGQSWSEGKKGREKGFMFS